MEDGNLRSSILDLRLAFLCKGPIAEAETAKSTANFWDKRSPYERDTSPSIFPAG